MDANDAELLKSIVTQQDIAALGTLHAGEPFVSMVPYALGAGGELVIHVSRLAAHTADMLAHAGVSLMITAARTPEVPAQAVARLSLQASARVCPPGDAAYVTARAAYLARFPESEPLFGFADFSLFLLTPHNLRFVAGFARARSLGADTWSRIFGSVAPTTQQDN
ncbi:MAG: pyridoxamine 5'-phosphate oxidase family protein [Rhodocyclaceae bacterium]|nr:pyridoxamine 5'-phosphate oxidase family protein [Rhodocyclaceae bacterium]MBX3670368.1 pyridoxamine 5'-phosphate oxidase family protein [Rhodocyclaceae bacterium]